MVQKGEGLAKERVPVTEDTLKRLKYWKIHYKTYDDVLNHLLDLAEKDKGNPGGTQIEVDKDTYKQFQKHGGNAKTDEQRLLRLMEEVKYHRDRNCATLEEIETLFEELERR